MLPHWIVSPERRGLFDNDDAFFKRVIKSSQILKRTREEIAHIEEEDRAANQVFQINMQVFRFQKNGPGC